MTTTESPHPSLHQPSQPRSSPVDSGTEDLSDKIRSEAVALLYNQTLGSLVGTFVLAGILALVESTVIDHRVATGWLGTLAAVSVLRYALLLGYRGSQNRESNSGLWHNLFVAGAVITALIWGSASVFLFAPASIPHQSLLGLIVAGVAAATVPVLAPSLLTTTVSLSLTLVPLVVQFLLQDSEIQSAMAAVLIVFYLFLLAVARSTHGTMLDSLALRQANLHLIEYLTSAKDRAEAARQRLQTEIQRRAEMEQQLKRAKDEAERTSKSKGDFLATISHEIRTPMNGVLAALELVQSMPLDAEQGELVSTAYSSAESLIGIINDVLDFSKIEVGRLELEEIEIDLRALVSEVTNLLGKRAQDKGLTISYEISQKTPAMVRGDPTRMRQILNNLVGNAVKFTEKGTIEIRIDLARSTPSRILLRFEVEDTGIGISPGAQANLFKPFTQAERSMARQFGGTGLGLSITKELVELMGGRIGVWSKQGEGSTFWFTLHLAKPALLARRRRTNLRGTLLLALTNDPELRAKLSVDFRNWRASVEFTHSADEMLEKLEAWARISPTWSYSAVVIDATCEPEHLSTLISEIRWNRSLTGLALVLIDEPKQGEQVSLEEVVDVRISRPYNSQVLFDALTELIDESALIDSMAVGTDEVPTQAEPFIPAQPPKPTGAGTLVPEAAELATKALQGRLLLVEDNLVNQKVAKNTLERLGLTVALAGDGFRAVEAIMHGTFDLILMDCQMPGMDGFQATRAIRRIEQNHRRERVPIIAVTANAMSGDRERCVEMGMDDYLAKPFKQEALRDILAKWLPKAAVSDHTDLWGSIPGESQSVLEAYDLTDPPRAAGRVLVADDDAVNRKLTRATLERLGYKVDVAANGGEAILAVEELGYDAILMDCEMPEVDGVEATLAIRRIEQEGGAPRTPILALTGHLEKSDRERCLQAGMDEVLAKPLRMEMLAQTLERYISRLQQNGQADAAIAANSKVTPGLALDGAIVADLREIMDDEFDDLVRMFLEETPERIQRLRDRVSAQDAEAVRVVAHTLKSSAANLGALSLAQHAKTLESLTRKGSLTGAAGLLDQMAEEYKHVRKELEAM